MKKLLFLVAILFLVSFRGQVLAQMPGAVPISLSNQTQTIHGQCYFVHVVERGQTVYGITRAYGMKEKDAYVKKDVNFLSIGDTVWLPCKLRTVYAQPNQSNLIAIPDGKSPAAKKEEKKNVDSKVIVVKSQEVPPPPVTPSNPDDTAVIKPLVQGDRIIISLMMPLNLEQMSDISTTKFDVEQRGKISYRSLEFIQFYEGLQMGLAMLEEQGVSVTLNVVDVPDNKPETVERLFASHNVAQSDLLIALLTRQPFAKAAELAKKNHLMIVNPVAPRSEIVRNNPYLFKCFPSEESKLSVIFDRMHRTYPNAHFLLVHHGGAGDKALMQTATQLLSERNDISYSVLSWVAHDKLQSILSKNAQTIVVSLYNQDQTKNRIYAGLLLNKLASDKSHLPVLVTLDDWTQQFSDIDYIQLQQLNYHTFYNGWDYSNPDHLSFLEQFRARYKTEPTEQYAYMGNDIVLYFATGLHRYGTTFWRHPSYGPVKGMIFPLSFRQKDRTTGYENCQAVLYRMERFVFHEAR